MALKEFISVYKPYINRINRLSWPIIVGQFGVVAMQVADTLMIGRIDATNLAAAGAANSVYFLICILGIGSLTAVSPLVAKAKAEKKPDECHSIYKGSLWAAGILAVIICTTLFVLSSNFYIFGQQAEVSELSTPFLDLLNISTIPLLFFLAAKQFSDGLSYTAPAAGITLIALLLNIFLNYLLIYGNWGLPAMGLRGAGYATIVSRVFMALSMMAYVHMLPRYKPYLNNVSLHMKQQLLTILKVGLPSGFQYFFEIGAFALAAIMMGWIGKSEQAAHHIAISLASLTYMIATGISVGGSIAVGDAYGRRNRNDMRYFGKASVLMGAVFMGCCALVFASFSPWIAQLFTSDVQVTQLTTGLLLIAAMFQLSDGIQCVSLGILRGLADTKIPTLITIMAYWVIGIPSGYALAFHFNQSLYGIWYGLSLGLTFSALFLFTRFLKESREMNLNV